MLKIFILGALQGLTEFFPVSSSGHLVIMQHFLEITENVIFLDTMLHIGTILALLTFFAKDILHIAKNPKLIRFILAATIITGCIGLTFKKIFTSFFNNASLVSIFIIINGFILLATYFIKDRKKTQNLADSILMGIAQGLAITPGISRSGLTISTLLARGIEKQEAFRFSFIASIPAIIGAFLMEAKATNFSTSLSPLLIITGLATSYIFGIIALSLLSRIINAKKFHWFGYYCIALGITLVYVLKV